MVEKNSLVHEQFKLTIPREIRSNMNIKIGTVVKWSTKENNIGTNEVTLTFVNI